MEKGAQQPAKESRARDEPTSVQAARDEGSLQMSKRRAADKKAERYRVQASMKAELVRRAAYSNSSSPVRRSGTAVSQSVFVADYSVTVW